MHHVNGKSDDLRAGSSNGHFLCGSAVGGSHTYGKSFRFQTYSANNQARQVNTIKCLILWKTNIYQKRPYTILGLSHILTI